MMTYAMQGTRESLILYLICQMPLNHSEMENALKPRPRTTKPSLLWKLFFLLIKMADFSQPPPLLQPKLEERALLEQKWQNL